MHLADALIALGPDVSLFTTARERLDPDWVESLASGSESEVTVRRRKMPVSTVVWLVTGANLLAHMSYADVMRHLGFTPTTRRGYAQTPPTSSSISEARRRVGAGPVARVFRAAAKVWNKEIDREDLRFRGLQVLAGDGVMFDVPDTPSNVAEFGKPGSTSPEPAAFPQARAVVLVDAFHHLALDAEIGGSRDGEISLLELMLPRVPDRTLIMLDRNFRSFGTLYRYQGSGSDRHWLLRARKDLQFREVEELGPGDHIVTVFPGYASRVKDPGVPREMKARLLRFSNGREEIRLLTSLHDPVKYPAMQVAELYLRRWEVEMAFDDMKTEQRGRAQTLRSKLPELVRQEIYGLLLAHNIVRVEIAHAAAVAEVPPTRISFHRALTHITHFMMVFAGSTAPGKALDRELELRSTLAYLLLPARRDRHYPRALRKTIPKYPRKKIGQPPTSP